MSDGIKTVYKSLGLCGFGLGSNSAAVDVKDGKILRIRPMHYDEKYDMESMRPGRSPLVTARCSSRRPTRSLSFAIRLQEARLLQEPRSFPLKRVDWDPEGDRHPETRGESKYVRISWDEATDIIAAELLRIKEQYGPSPSSPRSTATASPRSSTPPTAAGSPARPSGRLHPAGPPARQLGRLDLGRQAHLGHGPCRQAGSHREPLQGHRRERRLRDHVGRRPRDHAVGLGRHDARPYRVLLHRGGNQADLHQPRPELRRRRAC